MLLTLLVESGVTSATFQTQTQNYLEKVFVCFEKKFLYFKMGVDQVCNISYVLSYSGMAEKKFLCCEITVDLIYTKIYFNFYQKKFLILTLSSHLSHLTILTPRKNATPIRKTKIFFHNILIFF